MANIVTISKGWFMISSPYVFFSGLNPIISIISATQLQLPNILEVGYRKIIFLGGDQK
jgi:hypothetical protein